MPRKSPLYDSFVILYSKLEEQNPKSISDLVRETGFHHNTVRGYLELIEFIQTQPKLILERTGHSYQAKLNQNIGENYIGKKG